MFYAYSSETTRLGQSKLCKDAVKGALRIVRDVVVLHLLTQTDASLWFDTIEDCLVWLSPA